MKEADSERVERFFKCDERKRWVLGTNSDARRLAQVLNAAGFIDDFRPEELLDGLPVKRLHELTLSDWVVNASTCMFPMSAERRIVECVGENFVRFFELLPQLKQSWPIPDFVQASICSFHFFRHKWDWLSGILSDDRSRAVLGALVRYRSTADYRVITDVICRDQYFDATVESHPWLRHGVSFFDCGGYSGETSLEFARRNPHYETITFFEPSAKSLERARDKLAALQNITFIKSLVGEIDGFEEFDDSGSLSSSVKPGTGLFIPVTKLDDIESSENTYIKMDIEGYEMRALHGAQQTILNSGPSMAIAAYHFPNDVWSIAEFVLQLRSDYRVFLRHYTEGWADSVLYFVR